MSGNWPVIFDNFVHKKTDSEKYSHWRIKCVLCANACFLCVFETSFVNSRFQKLHIASIFGYLFRYDLGIIYLVSVVLVFFTDSVT